MFTIPAASSHTRQLGVSTQNKWSRISKAINKMRQAKDTKRKSLQAQVNRAQLKALQALSQKKKRRTQKRQHTHTLKLSNPKPSSSKTKRNLNALDDIQSGMDSGFETVGDQIGNIPKLLGATYTDNKDNLYTGYGAGVMGLGTYNYYDRRNEFIRNSHLFANVISSKKVLNQYMKEEDQKLSSIKQHLTILTKQLTDARRQISNQLTASVYESMAGL